MSRRNPEAVADTAAEQAKTGPILAHDIYRNNAEVIAYGCVPLGILQPWMTVRDTTWGLGKFWTLWMPDGGLMTPNNLHGRLMGTDIDPLKDPTGESFDATNLDEPDNMWDAVVIDGPYKLNGTSSGRGPAASDDAYGVHVPSKWQDRHQLIIDMMTEGHRILKPGGVMLVKMQDQVCSQKLRSQTLIFGGYATNPPRPDGAPDGPWGLGMELAHRFQLEGYREQPSDKIPGAQKTERSNFSVLHVYRKAR